MPQQLSEEELQNALSAQALSGWSVLNGKLHKDYEFADFDAAFGFMKKASFEMNLLYGYVTYKDTRVHKRRLYLQR